MPWLIVFGDVVGPSRRFTANELFSLLADNNRWYFSRRRKALKSGDVAAFYAKGLGVVGEAVISSIGLMSATDRLLLDRLGLGNYATKVELASVIHYSVPVDLKSQLGRMDLFSRSTARTWGVMLRTSPSAITFKDLQQIRAVAESQASQPSPL
jgi:hypothetical protein